MPDADRPNILIIQADQHRADCIGAYGNTDIRTPHIDALASDGVRYANSFCPYPVCTPSRYSFLSGLYVRQHLGGSNHCSLPAGLPTFPRLLRDAGYRTKAVGKMHLTPTYADVGFDELILAEQNGVGRYDDDYHRWLRQEGQGYYVDLLDQEREYRDHAPAEYWQHVGALESDLDEEHHSTTWIAEQAMDEVQTWQGGGHLLMASFIKPHHPFDPPAPWSRMYDPGELGLLPGYTPEPLPQDLAFSRGYFPSDEMTEVRIRRAMAYYYATISQIDHHVGRLTSLLREKGLYDNTLILYNSDHGDYMGYHHLLLKGNHMYEPLIRVPLIVKYPGQLQAGSVSDALVNTIDCAPTLLRQAGCDVPAVMPGLDLADAPQRPLVFAESGRGRSYMVRSPTHKLLFCQDDTHSQYFDLARDPHELQNLYREPAHQRDIADMKTALANWALFDAPYPVHTDEGAPIISAANAQQHNAESRDEIYAYFEGKMKERLRP
jgi:arylsulfatase A-like enzyme